MAVELGQRAGAVKQGGWESRGWEVWGSTRQNVIEAWAGMHDSGDYLPREFPRGLM